jgi:hypothetical protein
MPTDNRNLLARSSRAWDTLRCGRCGAPGQVWQCRHGTPFSRRVCARALPKNFQKPSPRVQPSSDKSGSGQPESSRSGSRRRPDVTSSDPDCNEAIKTKQRKGSGTPAGANIDPPQLSLRCALCKARTPSGVPQRLLPKGLFIPKAQRQATLLGTGRSVRSGTAAPTGGRRSCAAPRALPAPRDPSCSEAPRTPVIVPAG